MPLAAPKVAQLTEIKFKMITHNVCSLEHKWLSKDDKHERSAELSAFYAQQYV